MDVNVTKRHQPFRGDALTPAPILCPGITVAELFPPSGIALSVVTKLNKRCPSLPFTSVPVR